MVHDSKIDRFIGKVEMGRSFFEDAAALLVSLIDEEPQVCERILALNRVPWMSRAVLQTFEFIGRKQLSVGAMFLPKHILDRLIGLPLELQTELASKSVQVIAPRSGNSRITDAKPVAKLTRKEAVIVIGPKGIRSPEEQAEFARKIEAARIATGIAKRSLSTKIARKAWEVLRPGDDFDGSTLTQLDMRHRLIAAIEVELG